MIDAKIETHKPGPWGYHDTPYAVGQGMDWPGKYHAIGTPHGDLIVCRASNADARLISAAPELLDAVKAAKHWFESNYPSIPGGMDNEVLVKLGTVLGKAESITP